MKQSKLKHDTSQIVVSVYMLPFLAYRAYLSKTVSMWKLVDVMSTLTLGRLGPFTRFTHQKNGNWPSWCTKRGQNPISCAFCRVVRPRILWKCQNHHFGSCHLASPVSTAKNYRPIFPGTSLLWVFCPTPLAAVDNLLNVGFAIFKKLY